MPLGSALGLAVGASCVVAVLVSRGTRGVLDCALHVLVMCVLVALGVLEVGVLADTVGRATAGAERASWRVAVV